MFKPEFNESFWHNFALILKQYEEETGKEVFSTDESN